MQEVPAAAIPPGSLPPPPETDSVGFVILLAEHEEPSLAAKKMRQLGASSWATSTPKKRVWGFANTPSGRPSVEPLLSWETAAGSVQYTYQLASGRAEWLSSSSVYLPSGTDTVPVVATDAAGNVRTNKYQVTAAGGGTTTPTYDTDGNELSSGAGQAYTWDAKNEVMSTLIFRRTSRLVLVYEA